MKNKTNKKYMKYWESKKHYEIWKYENEIWHLFYESEKNNSFNDKYYLLLILLVSYCKYDNDKAKELILEWNLEFERIKKRDKKIMEKLKGKK